MPLLRSSRRVLLGEKITPADVFDAHSERVIAEGRAILCALSLLAIWLDPGQLADSPTAMPVLIAYSALALALLAIPFWKFPGPVAGYLVHATDIGFLAALGILSQARPGPFFLRSLHSSFSSRLPCAGIGRGCWRRALCSLR